MMQYFHDLEPRKIANQIITVREDLSCEMIQDLGCVRLENVEAIRFASEWASSGLIVAERSRKITRMTEQSESTPGRDGNYMVLNTLITELAIDILKKDLLRFKDDLSIEVIDELVIKLKIDDEKRTMLERILHDSQGPRSFIEQLYFKGITEGVKIEDSKSVNILKLAENLLNTRLDIAKEVAKLISLQNQQNRQYYKMIKDYGGFQKLVMSTTPKMKFVDLDAQALEESNDLAKRKFEETVNKEIEEELAAEREIKKGLENSPSGESDGKNKELDVGQNDGSKVDYSSNGPMMM
jgi:hypothetical protein